MNTRDQEFCFKMPFVFILNSRTVTLISETEFHEWQLSGLDVQITAKCHSQLTGYSNPPWSCFSDDALLVPNFKEAAACDREVTTLDGALQVQFHWLELTKFSFKIQYKINFGILKRRYDWCAPLSYASTCMLVNHRPSWQSCEEECKPP